VPPYIWSYRRAVAEGARRFGCAWEARQVGDALAMQAYRRRTRDFLLDRLDDRTLGRIFDVKGLHHLERALDRKQGVVLLINHFGSHLSMVHWLMRKGFAVRCFGERPRSVSHFIRKQFEADGPLGQIGLFIRRSGTPSASAPMVMQAVRLLNAGWIVTVASDIRWRDARAVNVRFLGRDDSYSSTWVNLAALSGAAVVPSFCHLDRRGRYCVEFRPAFGVPRAAMDPREAGRWVQRQLDELEQEIRRHPEQSDDYFFWDEDRRRDESVAASA
jgi:KDO2-lipid IV(A) lauroyltransferase